MSVIMPAFRGFRLSRLVPIATAVTVTLLVGSTLGLMALLAVWTALDLLGAPTLYVWAGDAIVGVLVAIPCIRFGVNVWRAERGELS